MSSGQFDFSLAIGGAAGQGIATPGNILARMFTRRGLSLYAYNAYQSIVRGGHIFLTMRINNQAIYTHGDSLNMLVCLNQDTMDRHPSLMKSGGCVIYDSDKITPGELAAGVQLCPLPIKELSNKSRNKVIQNTIALGAINYLVGMEFDVLENSLNLQFSRKGDAVVTENSTAALAGYEFAKENFKAYPDPLPKGPKPLALWTGNEAMAMGGAAAGVKFYSAYPMSPSTGVLHWMAKNARELDIMVMEIPAVFINVQRAGPSTGVPTKTEQGDLWQALGASQGDFERLIVAPTDALDSFNVIPELFNLCDQHQCPGIVISDLLIAEGTFSADPDDLNLNPEINRGEIITASKSDESEEEYLRYKITDSGVSPRALPGLKGHVHVVATDEHDQDGVLISDEYTNPHKRRRMVEKRARKIADITDKIKAPTLEGASDAEVTLIGWGSTYGVIKEAIEQLTERGGKVNLLPIRWIVPFHSKEVIEIVEKAKHTIIIENNYSGQFYRYMRSETGLSIDGHIRKYDGEPFMPHHIVDSVLEQLDGKTNHSVPVQEIMV